jgi:hypothetical protein
VAGVAAAAAVAHALLMLRRVSRIDILAFVLHVRQAESPLPMRADLGCAYCDEPVCVH